MLEDTIGHIGLVEVGWEKDRLVHARCVSCGWSAKTFYSVGLVTPILEHHREVHPDYPLPTVVIETTNAERPPDHS